MVVVLFPANTINRCEVENMKASFLGCGEERQGGGRMEGEMGTTEEKCLYEYNLTLSFEETMGRWGLTNTLNENVGVFAVFANMAFYMIFILKSRTVMLDRGGVELMCSVLKPGMNVLEYGSGGSTTFFR